MKAYLLLPLAVTTGVVFALIPVWLGDMTPTTLFYPLLAAVWVAMLVAAVVGGICLERWKRQ